MVPLDDVARGGFATAHPDWEIEGEIIQRTFLFNGFGEAMGFVVRVAMAAEVADHHPDIDIRWNKVTLKLTTHSEKALTEKDTALAAFIDEMV